MVTTCMWKPVFENTKAYVQREAIKRTQGPAEIKRVTSVLEIWVSWGWPFDQPSLLLSQKFLPLLQLSLLATPVPKQRQRGGATRRIRTGSKTSFAWQWGKLVICRPSRHTGARLIIIPTPQGNKDGWPSLPGGEKRKLDSTARLSQAWLATCVYAVLSGYHDNPVDLASAGSGATPELFSIKAGRRDRTGDCVSPNTVSVLVTPASLLLQQFGLELADPVSASAERSDRWKRNTRSHANASESHTSLLNGTMVLPSSLAWNVF